MSGDMYDPEREAIRAEQLEGENEAAVEAEIIVMKEEPTVPEAGEVKLPAPKRAPKPSSTVATLVPVVNGKLAPVDLDGFGALAHMFCKAGCAPRGLEDPGAMTVALIAGSELGLSWTQTLSNIMVVNHKPSVYGDAILGLVQNRAEGYHSCKVIYEEDGKECEKKPRDEMGDSYACVVTIFIFPPILLRLKELSNEDYALVPYRASFSVAEAKAAGLWNKSGPWTLYTNDMLYRRSLARSARVASPEALLGMSSVEEMRDVQEERSPEYEVKTRPSISIEDLTAADEPLKLE